MQHEPLSRVCRDFFLAIGQFADDGLRGDLDPKQWRQTLREMFAAQKALADQLAIPAEIYDQARYAMVALADDLAVHTDWDGADDWNRTFLQYELFGNAFAGAEFFDRLEEIRSRAQHAQEPVLRAHLHGLLEVYFACLRMGFRGRYRGAGGDELDTITKGALKALWPAGEEGLRKRHCPRAYAAPAKGGGRRRHRWWWWPVPVSFAAVVGTYFWMLYAQEQRIEHLKDHVTKAVDSVVEEGRDRAGGGG